MQLIPLQYLNEACFLSLNEDEKKYNMVLKQAQDDLKDILGKAFYDQIETQYQSTFSAANSELYEDYIKDFLAWQTYYYYLQFVNVNATPTGIREFGEENSEIASDLKMFSLEKNVMNRAMKYKGRMISFLKKEKQVSSTNFPLWREKCDSYGISFAISSISKKNTEHIQINKTIRTSE